MRMKTPLIAGALCLVSAVPAHACYLYTFTMFNTVPDVITWGAGTSIQLGDYTYFSPTATVAMKLGDKAVVQPGIGICSGEGSTDPFFGASVALQVSQNANMTVNIQSGIEYLTYDGGNEMTIPIGAAAQFGSNAMKFYAGGSLLWTSYSFDSEFGDVSGSDSDPVLFGGIMGASGSLGWTLGGGMKLGDDTDFAIVVGINMNKASSALRNFGRAIRK
jgi:hypothetical protein